MAVPDFQSIMLPLLRLTGDGKEHFIRDVIETLAQEFRLTDEDRREVIPSGLPMFDNRVSWARTYMKKAGLLISPKRSYIQITERGLDVLRQNHPRINTQFLRQFPEFQEFQQKPNVSVVANDDSATPKDSDQQTPAEAVETAYQKIRQDLAIEILQTVKSCSPAFFERLVVDLLVKMGYGGTRKDAGRAIGSSGDGGIDGIINEDRLGLDVVYIQAKRWDSSVGRPEVQKFAGALQGQRARKGIFITTSTYSQGALDFASRIESKIILIDGETLAQLMIDYNVGVSTVTAYEIKRIDSDYFAGEA
jgi:restriction system protein